jgi:UDP-glucuronate decarboxylase
MHPNDGRVVSNFIIQALQGNPLTVYGKGQQTRSFQYVDDLVEGLMRLMNSDYVYPVNIGNPKGEMTILEFAKLLREMINPKLDIKFLPKTKDDPTQRKPDITVAKREIHGWEPQVSVKKGLQETIKYFSDELKLQGEFTPIKPKELRGKTAQIGDV